MAAPVLQSVDPAHPSLDPQPGPSRTATVADESDELAAEAGIVTNGISSNTGGNARESEEAQFQAGGEAGQEGQGGQGEEEEVDPDAIPDYACETLYIQNLNEKVKTQGEWKCGLFLWILWSVQVNKEDILGVQLRKIESELATVRIMRVNRFGFCWNTG
jgi:hypothetical protein